MKGPQRARRAGPKGKGTPPPRVPADDRLLQVDLADWAGAPIARSGRQYALLGRVESIKLASDGRSVDALVRGGRPTPHQVRVEVDPDGDGLLPHCTCDEQRGPVCRHAVAAIEMLRFPLSPLSESSATAQRRRNAGRVGQGRGRVIQQAPLEAGFMVIGGMERTLTREERLEQAEAEELQARKQRARRERAKVEPIASRGMPPKFRVYGRKGSRPYVVTLRDPKGEAASCSCPDYEKSELPTCKHIERVCSWYSRKKKEIPDDVLSLWWRPRVWIDEQPRPLEEVRVDAPGSLKRTAAFFDEHGWHRAPRTGVQPTEFLAQAIEAVQSEAAERGWQLEIDPAVERQREQALRSERVQAMLSQLDARHPAWQEIVGSLGFKLHRYQEQGALFLARAGRTFLADDMGLGKTIQAIAATLLLRRTAGTHRALIVCPASLKHQWRQEIRKACGERAVVVEGRHALRLADYERWRRGFLVLNYELVLRDLEYILSARPNLVILDEAQRIKNWDTKTAKAVKQLLAPFAFVLTGTPLENRLGELHSLVEFLHPRALGPRWRLRPLHSITDTQGRELAYEGLQILRRRMRGFFLRRERAEVLDELPERTDNTFWTAMSPTQRRPYRKHAARVASLVGSNQPLQPGDVRTLLQALTNMRILCNAYAQYAWSSFEERVLSDGVPSRADLRALGSPKLEEFVNVLEDLLEESHSKIVVFSQWERALRLALYASRELMQQREEKAEIFHGRLTSRARSQVLKRFHDDDRVRLLFSTDAGGQGLNLQESASVVVNLEVPWNPAVLEQRIGRVHRLGQRESVQVLHFVTSGAVEERVRQVVESKKALFEGLLVDEVDRVVLDRQGRSSFVERVRSLLESESG